LAHDAYFDWEALEKCESRQRARSLPARRHPKVDEETSSNISISQDIQAKTHCEAKSKVVVSEFDSWFKHRRPLLCMSPALSRQAWDFPLAKSEKRELLLLNVAAGEKANADAAMASAEAAAFEAAERSRIEGQLCDATRTMQSKSLRPQCNRLSGLTRKPRASIGKKSRRISIA
jgi:hypothetical protein